MKGEGLDGGGVEQFMRTVNGNATQSLGKSMKSGFWRRQWTKRAARQTKRLHGIPWGIIAIVLLATVVAPTLADVQLAQIFPDFLHDLQESIIVIFTLTSLMIIWESLAAWRIPPLPSPAEDLPLPPCTAIIAAYLPNEQDIILETLQHMLGPVDVPRELFQVILAYNTPENLPIEAVLWDMAARDPRLCVLRVEGSRSKAENVNAALQAATGEIVAVYDADHLPDPDCFRKAWRWLARGYHVVQGRCVIRNYAENWLTRTVAVEFDSIYAISHQGRSNISKTAIFGGSNGYWRRDALRDVGMNGAMLTEDIDSSVRTLLAGRRMIHDRSILSFELAPTEPKHWFFQRKRWAQGWLEVTLVHIRALMRTPHLTLGQKVLWFYLLAWREIYPLLAMQFFPLVFTGWWLARPLDWFGTPLLLGTSILNLTTGLFQTWVTYQRASREGRRTLGRWFFVYGLGSLVYTTVKTTVTLVAQYGHLRRDRAWVTTPRTPPAEAPPAQEPPRVLASCESQSNKP